MTKVRFRSPSRGSIISQPLGPYVRAMTRINPRLKTPLIPSAVIVTPAEYPLSGTNQFPRRDDISEALIISERNRLHDEKATKYL